MAVQAIWRVKCDLHIPLPRSQPAQLALLARARWTSASTTWQRRAESIPLRQAQGIGRDIAGDPPLRCRVCPVKPAFKGLSIDTWADAVGMDA